MKTRAMSGQMASLMTALLAGCAGAPPDLAQPTKAEYVSIDVDQGAFVDRVDLFVASPHPGRFPEARPVVVYMHGMGKADVVRCRVEPPLRPDAERIVKQFAQLGYIGVGVAYRSQGGAAPDAIVDAATRMRDSRRYDAKAMLAAANHVHDTHAQAADAGRVTAFVGVSAGPHAITWGLSDSFEQELGPLRRSLDIRTAILTGSAANHVAGLEQSNDRLDAASNGNVMASAAATPLMAVSSHLGLRQVNRATVAGESDSEADVLLDSFWTDAGRRVAERFFFQPAGDTGEACEAFVGRVPPFCSRQCLEETWEEEGWHKRLDATGVATLLTPDVIQAVTWWRDNVPPGSNGPHDPGADHPNSFLRILRNGSPVYAAQGPAHTDRALVVYSLEGDRNFDREALDDQRRWWLDRGGLSAPADSADWAAPGFHERDPRSKKCGHGDYFSPEKPECGWNDVVRELETALR